MRSSITSSGAVQLAPVLACDGFVYGTTARVQTHVHVDHMREFESSKGYQDIIALPGTCDLLINDFNADLAYRTNLIRHQPGAGRLVDGYELRLLDSGHMLGSAQVEVTHPDGYKVGYSGDFSWPLDEVISVDELVVDSTYGAPGSLRTFSHAEAADAFVSLALTHVRRSPVYVYAFRGTLQRALCALGQAADCPIIVSPRQLSEARVYQDHGYALPELLEAGTPEALAVQAEGSYVLVRGQGDPEPTNLPDPVVSIAVGGFGMGPEDPVLVRTPRSFRVALSNHADFEQTLEYVAATGAQLVITDNIRGPAAAELAVEIEKRLGVEARPSAALHDRTWGSST
jgi:putative mRNA 3-end processing factor